MTEYLNQSVQTEGCKYLNESTETYVNGITVSKGIETINVLQDALHEHGAR